MHDRGTFVRCLTIITDSLLRCDPAAKTFGLPQPHATQSSSTRDKERGGCRMTRWFACTVSSLPRHEHSAKPNARDEALWMNGQTINPGIQQDFFGQLPGLHVSSNGLDDNCQRTSSAAVVEWHTAGGISPRMTYSLNNLPIPGNPLNCCIQWPLGISICDLKRQFLVELVE